MHSKQRHHNERSATSHELLVFLDFYWEPQPTFVIALLVRRTYDASSGSTRVAKSPDKDRPLILVMHTYPSIRRFGRTQACEPVAKRRRGKKNKTRLPPTSAQTAGIPTQFSQTQTPKLCPRISAYGNGTHAAKHTFHADGATQIPP